MPSLNAPLADPIPREEVLRLGSAVLRAEDYASDDRVLTGYLILYAGRMAAEQETLSWSGRFAVLWNEALEAYKLRYPRNWGVLD
jgi:hypothetical protein